MTNPAASCAICSLHQDSAQLAVDGIWSDERWLLRHHPQPAPLVGWCLLDARRHLAGPMAFTPDEASDWGRIVRQASQWIQTVTGCERVYAIAFGEGARHLHLHLIPRDGADDRTKAWSVADLYRQVEAGIIPAADRERIADFIAAARQLADPHRVD